MNLSLDWIDIRPPDNSSAFRDLHQGDDAAPKIILEPQDLQHISAIRSLRRSFDLLHSAQRTVQAMLM